MAKAKKKAKKEQVRKCLVHGCANYSDAGVFIGDLCAPCHEMLTTGEVHHANPTFIGNLWRKALGGFGSPAYHAYPVNTHKR